MLGYFSIICLLRVHVLLGDFTLALKAMENVELSQKAPLTRVTACHVSTYYYVGFCYITLRRYPDAIRIFVSILNFISRMRRYHTRSYQYDQVRDFCYFLISVPDGIACIDQQNGGQDVRPLRNLQRTFSEQVGRQHSQHSKRTIWRSNQPNDAWVIVRSGSRLLMGMRL